MKRLIVFTVLLLTTVYAVLSAEEKLSLPVRNVSLFTSGVSYVRHTGQVEGNRSLEIVISKDAVNDVLKSIVVRDPRSTGAVLSFSPEGVIDTALGGLSIDFSGEPSLIELFSRMKGALVEVRTPDSVQGRIAGTEIFHEGTVVKQRLILLTAVGFVPISIQDISSFHFLDTSVAEDIEVALRLFAESRSEKTRTVSLSLQGNGSRVVEVGYILPAPVWKATWRLDYSEDTPVLQGWAIVENTSDNDWNGIELSLISGRPVSFIQNLYDPYYVDRPTIPLAIAGTLKPRTHEEGFSASRMMTYGEEVEMPMAAMESFSDMKRAPALASGSSATSMEARPLGDIFEFTSAAPVTLGRRQSAMIPLVDAPVRARKITLLQGKDMSVTVVHPLLCIEMVNTSGVKLPAGPVTVFDEGQYAGDALMDFLAENGKKLISYAEDVALTAGVVSRSEGERVSVTVTRGVMTITRRNSLKNIYSVKNSANRARTLLLEHPVRQGASLVSPATYTERTAESYRFEFEVPAAKEASLVVIEETPVLESVQLGRIALDSLVYYASTRDIPETVRKALDRLASQRRIIEQIEQEIGQNEELRATEMENQERIRQNMLAVGPDSATGKEYVQRLTISDRELEKLGAELVSQRKKLLEAKMLFDQDVASLSITE